MIGDSPRVIGRYEIRREIGRGSMGIVYQAHDRDLDRTVALKTISLAFTVSTEDRERFEARFFAEARIAARLSHPGIVVVHDVGRDEPSGLLYMVLEYLEGQTLDERLGEGEPMEWREALHVVRRLADALDYAHSQRVVHRDVKPANVMILSSGEPKIMDFGIAKIETARMKLTMQGQFFGTPLYMSPEQALGHSLDHRIDLFALGAVAYQLVTGQQAFGGPNLAKIISRVVHDDPAPPSFVIPTLPPDLDRVLARALAKNREDRYPTGRSLAEDVEDLLAGRPPRHVEGWAPSAPGTDVPEIPAVPQAPVLDGDEADIDLALSELTHAGAAAAAPADLDGELARLVHPLPAPAPAAPTPPLAAPTPAGRATAAAVPLDPTVRSQERAAPARVVTRPGGGGQRTGVSLWLLGTAVAFVAVIAVSAYVAGRAGTRRSPLPSPGGATAPPALPGESPRVPAAAPFGAEPAASAAPSAGEVASGETGPSSLDPARLEIDFEHGLKAGELRVWIDDELVLEEALDSRVTKKILAIKKRKGSVEEALDVAPGRHTVRVQVAWDDNRKTERIAGTFRPGSTRRLGAKLGGFLRKNLSLEWE